MATDETTAGEAFKVMLERHYRHLPVVDDQGKVLGILSIRNILEARIDDLLDELESKPQALNQGSELLIVQTLILLAWQNLSHFRLRFRRAVTFPGIMDASHGTKATNPIYYRSLCSPRRIRWSWPETARSPSATT